MADAPFDSDSATFSEMQAAEHFLRQIEESGAVPPGVRTEDAAGAVICPFLEALEEENVAAIVDILPVAVWDFARECRLFTEVVPDVTRDEFLRLVAEHIPTDVGHAERLTGAVFRALQRQLPPAVIERIEGDVIDDLREMWRVPSASQ